MIVFNNNIQSKNIYFLQNIYLQIYLIERKCFLRIILEDLLQINLHHHTTKKSRC